MNKNIMLAMVALVAVGIMLASGVGAQLIGPGSVPPATGDEENAEMIDDIMEEVADQGGQTTRGEVAAALMQAEAMGADVDGAAVKTSADMSDSGEMGYCSIGQCEWHVWIWVCPPVYETHAALLWNECSDSDLDLYICNAGGYAVSNADHTLTEEVAVTGCGVNYIWVHAPKVDAEADCGYQPYALAVDCELPKICEI